MTKLKKFFSSLLFLLVFTSSFASLLFFPENQAAYSSREYSQVRLPGSVLQAGVANDAFDYNGFEKVLNMCKTDYTLTDDDRDFLTANDFKFKTYNNLTALDFGSWNWNFSSRFIAYGNLVNLSSNFLSFIFEGNMDSTAMMALKDMNPADGSEALVFLKSSFVYSKKQPIYIDNFLDIDFLNFTFCPGFSVNLYTPIYYAKVETDYFTITDSSADISFTKYKSDADDFFSGFGLGMGVGVKMEIQDGWIYFSIDDLMGSMTYNKVTKEKIEVDLDLPGSVDFDGQEAYEEDLYNHTVFIDPTVVFGLERYLTKDFSYMVKFKDCDYALDDGYSVGFNYMPNLHCPMQMVVGNGQDDKMFYKLKAGLIFSYFETSVAFFFFDGFFTSAKGYGIEADLFKIKF